MVLVVTQKIVVMLVHYAFGLVFYIFVKFWKFEYNNDFVCSDWSLQHIRDYMCGKIEKAGKRMNAHIENIA